MGSWEGCCLLGLVDCSGAGVGGAAEVQTVALLGQAPCDKVNGWEMGACPIKM